MRLTMGSSPATYLQCAINDNALLDIRMYLFNCVVTLINIFNRSYRQVNVSDVSLEIW